MTSAIAALGCDVTAQEMQYASCFSLPYASFGGSELCERVCVVKWFAKIVLVAVVPVVVVLQSTKESKDQFILTLTLSLLSFSKVHIIPVNYTSTRR